MKQSERWVVAVVLLLCLRGAEAQLSYYSDLDDPRRRVDEQTLLLYDTMPERLWNSEDSSLVLAAIAGDYARHIVPLMSSAEWTPHQEVLEKVWAEKRPEYRRHFEEGKNPYVKALILRHYPFFYGPPDEWVLKIWHETQNPTIRGAAFYVLTRSNLSPLKKDDATSLAFHEEAIAWLSSPETEPDLCYALGACAGWLADPRESANALPLKDRQRIVDRLAEYLDSSDWRDTSAAVWALCHIEFPGRSELILNAIARWQGAEGAKMARMLLDGNRVLPLEEWNNPVGLAILRSMILGRDPDCVSDGFIAYRDLRGLQAALRVMVSAAFAGGSGIRKKAVLVLSGRKEQVLAALADGWRPADYTDEEVEALRAMGLPDEIADALLKRPGAPEDKKTEPRKTGNSAAGDRQVAPAAP